MNELRPFHLIVLFIFGISAIVGIFIFANFSGGGGAKKDAVGAVVIWGTLPKAPFESALAELSGAEERFSDVTYVEKSAVTFSTELSGALAEGAGPDLILLSQEMLNAEQAKLYVIPYASLPQRTFLDSYVSLFELFLTNEGTYGVPLLVDPLVLYYNRTILSAESIVAPPSTWEAVSGFATEVTQRDPGGTIVRSAIALGEYGNVRNARAILSLLLLQAGSDITAPTEIGMRSVFADDDPGSFGTTPAQSAINYYTQFADPAKNVYSWNRSLPESRESFLAGDSALYLGFASERVYIASANPNLDFDMTSVPIPGTSRARVNYGVGYAFALPKTAANGAGALEVAFALGGQTSAGSIANALGAAPAYKYLLSAPPEDPYKPIYYPAALSAKGWISPVPTETDRIFLAMIVSITTGRASVDEALRAAAGSLDAALR
ncbi:MAG: hypothetical protein WBK28_01875 [Minisyncoccia bacterium]